MNKTLQVVCRNSEQTSTGGRVVVSLNISATLVLRREHNSREGNQAPLCFFSVDDTSGSDM